MSIKIDKIKINQIDDLDYNGYYWLSKEPKPHIVEGKFDKTILQDLPFVVEANLYDEDKQISISIKNVDGEYLITKYDLSKLSADEIKTAEKYLSDRTGDFGKYRIYTYWQEKQDNEFLEGMSSLERTAEIFVGFTN